MSPIFFQITFDCYQDGERTNGARVADRIDPSMVQEEFSVDRAESAVRLIRAGTPPRVSLSAEEM